MAGAGIRALARLDDPKEVIVSKLRIRNAESANALPEFKSITRNHAGLTLDQINAERAELGLLPALNLGLATAAPDAPVGAPEGRGSLDDALANFLPVPKEMLAKARWLCREHRTWRSADINSHAVVTVQHPTRTWENRHGDAKPLFMVFLTSYSHQFRRPQKDVPGRALEFAVYVPDSYLYAVDQDQADEIASQVINAWSIDREDELAGTGQEVPWSPEWINSVIEVSHGRIGTKAAAE